jgi:hypothetical protein
MEVTVINPSIRLRIACLFLVSALALLVPTMVTWAVKSGATRPGLSPSGDLDAKDIDQAALSYFQRMAAPKRERPLGLSLFENFNPNIPPLPKRKGLVYTQAGFFNPKDLKSFEALPADLRGVVAHPAPQGRGLGLGSGTGIIQISEESLKNPGYDKIGARIQELGATLLETRQDRALVVRGDAKAMAALVRESFVDAAIPYAPAFKLDPMAGRQMLLDKVRASKMELDVQIRTWNAKGVDAVLKDLKSVHSDTVSLLDDGRTIRATLDKSELKRVLKMDDVSDVHEIPEYQLSAAFVLVQDPPVVQVGEAEHTFAATPYWDAGVDGGGCGYCSNAFGTACTSNAGCVAPGTCVHASASQCTTSIPATVVAVLDNGASTDAANLAHSTSALNEAAVAALIAGGSHRKIAAYQVVSDTGVLGTTCDNVLSGGQTHGQIVAGVIAGNASALGFTFQRSSNAGSFGDVRRFNLDGAARGARLTIQDAGGSATCAVSDLEERGLVSIASTTLPARMDAAYATGARLHVMPFGIPVWNANGTTAAGVYNVDAQDLDKYLVNNLEYMVFEPVGNKGFALLNGRDQATDLFDGESSATSDPFSVGSGLPSPLQVSPPSTAKNGVAAGATCSDTFTMFGPFNEEENVQNYTAKGPATAASLRTAPILVGVGNDRTPTGGGPAPLGIYGVKSTDNDQGGNIDAEVSEQARGTSFGAASLAAAATLMEDYFHQGFYPTGDRVQGDRVSVLSGSAVKAMLAASANFTEQLIGLKGNVRFMDGFDVQVATTRGSIVPIFTVPTVLGNNQQGYGRPILTQVLPLGNWANYGIPPDGVATQDTIEKPALGLLVWEHGVDTNGATAGLGESLPVFSGGAGTTQDHKFTVLGNQGQLRACMSYTDPHGDLLVNDLDLEIVTPAHCTTGDLSRVCVSVADCGGAGSCVATTYDGNVYNPNNEITGQWGLAQGGINPGDKLNPLECVHLSEDPDGNPASTDSQIVPGTWTLRVKYGSGGAAPNSISDIGGANEDANGNNRLDGGEDTDGDGRLDKGGQPYAAVISGSVVPLKGDATTPAWFADYPTSLVRLDKIRYTCRDDASVLIQDGDANVVTLPGLVTARVFYNATSPVQVDSEVGFTFGGSNSTFTSVPLPVRQATTGTANNGVLEGDTDYIIEVTYADPTAGSRTVVARAPMNCEPNFLGGVFVNPGARNAPDLVFGGCDNDQSFDKNERVTYSVAVVNNDLFDDFTDVTATLTACNVAFVNGSCSSPTPAGTFAILDSPKNIGRLPVGQPEAVSFSVQVGAGPFAAGQRVFLRLDLSATGGPKLLGRLNLEFVHPLGTDKASLHYSTDYPNGSAQISRDLNRSLVIEPNDRPGLTLGLLDETIAFSSLFVVDPATGRVNNQIRSTCVANTTRACVGGSNPGTLCPVGTECTGGGACLPLRAACTTDANCGGIAGSCVADEAYPALGIFTPGAGDGVLDRHMLVDSVPLSCSVDGNACTTNADCAGGATPTPPDVCRGNDLIPWSFDTNNGGWYTARDASSAPGATPATLPLWHWVNNGTCGFQTQSKSNCVLVDGTPGNDPDGAGAAPCAALTVGAFTGGAWHTGSGQAGACRTGGAACYLDSDCTGGTGPCDGRCVGGPTPGATCANTAACGAGGTCVFGADYLDCGNYGVPFNTATPRRAEFVHDYLVSPIIEKVNQGLDASGYPFAVEFQRFGFNDTAQFRYADNTVYVNIDNNTDSNSPNAIVRPGVFRGDGWTYYAFQITGRIDPVVSQEYYNQTTFGPTTDPDASLSHCAVVPVTSCTSDATCRVCVGGSNPGTICTLPAGAECLGGGVCTEQGPCGKLTGDESGFPGFDRQSTNTRATKPKVPVAPSNLRPFPGPAEVHPVGSEDTVAGPSRNVDVDIVDYEDGIQFFTPGDAGNRFQIGMGFLLVEQVPGAGAGDFGISVDDVVFEWDETHPVPEAVAACDRIGIGGPTEIAAGCRCPTLAVDRTNLYDCNETVAITVEDSRYAAGATCDPTGTGAVDMILINVWSNSEPYPGQMVTLTETGAATGVFKGTVPVSGIFNSDGPDGAVFTVPGLETNLFFAYGDSSSACDSNHNHLAGQSDFNNLDGDGLGAAQGRDGICGTSDDDPTKFGADGVCGFNPVSGLIDDTGDNCALVNNPAQTDYDGDKVGGNNAISPTVYAGCDNCPLTANPDQADGDLDGVGDVCDWDDVDGDGVDNFVDNCPEVPNEGFCDNSGNACSFHGGPLPACAGGNAAHCQPGQAGGVGPLGQACSGTFIGPDLDADGVPDVADNCPLTANPPQADADAPPPFNYTLGDACDGDCQGTCGAGSTLRAPGDRCAFSSECGGSGVCGGRVCSAVDDDADIDAVSDVQDNCPVTSNPTPLPGSNPPVQIDDNLNGLGNACDPAGSFDENADGLPDDVANGPFFALAVTCKNIPLANIVLLSPVLRDRAELKTCTGGPNIRACPTGTNVGKACDGVTLLCPGSACPAAGPANDNSCGDGDGFGDPGERVRMALFLQNISGFDLTGINLSLSTADPDIECLLDASIQIANFPNNTTLDTRTLTPADDPAQPTDGKFFEVVVSPATNSTNPATAARANLTMTVTSNEAGGTVAPVAITTLLDLDIPPGAVVTRTAARCDGDFSTPATAGILCANDAACGGAVGSCKPGLIYEGFETPGPGGSGTGGVPQPNDFSTTIGFIEHSVATGDSETTVNGAGCFFGGPGIFGCVENPYCCIDPDGDTDWHFETAAAPMRKAYRGGNSGHWGRHTDATNRGGDTTPLRMVEAFDTNPINLTPLPGGTDLMLSYWQIVSFVDDNRINFLPGQAGDYADVQIAVDQDPTAVDSWGRWQKLVPFQNVYEHTPQVWSHFAYCTFTPTDAAAASNPAVYGETMCFPDGVWSHSGNVLGTNVLNIFQAQGPGVLGSQGDGIWVQSKFNLGMFIGQRVKIRWVAESWGAFGNGYDSYLEGPVEPPFDLGSYDDGWWLDEIQITGAITTPINPIVDPTSIPLTTQCPASAADNCNQALGTIGFGIDFRLSDTDNDGSISPGEEILLDASQTTNPGGCADGVPQFRFLTAHSLCVGGSNPGGACPTGFECTGGGTCTGETAPIVLQDWSTQASLQLSNSLPTDHFDLSVRCSSDFSCTATSTGEPVGQHGAGCAFRNFQPPATPLATHPATFTSWSFGDACAGQGAPGALLCARTHRFDSDPDPLIAGAIGFTQPAANRRNGVVTTVPLPIGVTGQVAAGPCRFCLGGTNSGTNCPTGTECTGGGACSSADFGLCAGTPFGAIGALSPGAAICGIPGGAVFGAGVNSCNPPSPGLACPVGPLMEVTCGDATPIALNTVQYYLAGVHSRADAAGGCACTSPACMAAGSVAFVHPNPLGVAGGQCYRWDDDPAAGSPAIFNPGGGVGYAGCP